MTDMILTGGSNVYPAEVESALQEHPAVRSCAVIGLPDDDLGQRVHAIVEAEPTDRRRSRRAVDEADCWPSSATDSCATRCPARSRSSTTRCATTPARCDAAPSGPSGSDRSGRPTQKSDVRLFYASAVGGRSVAARCDRPRGDQGRASGGSHAHVAWVSTRSPARRHDDRGAVARRLQLRVVERDADAELLPLPGQLGRGAEGGRQLQRGQPTAPTRSSTRSCPRAPTASASRWCAAWRPRTRRWTSSASTSRGRPSSPRPGGSGSGPATTRPRSPTAPWPARSRPPPTRTSSGRRRSTATPSCSGTAPTWCRRPPTTWDEMIEMSEQLAQQGKPHLHRDPGQPVRGHHRVVQHAAGQRRRQRAQRGRRRAVDGPARGRRPAASCTTWPPRRPPTRRCRCSRRTTTAWRWRRGTAAFELNYPFVYPSMKKDEPGDVRELQVGALPGGEGRRAVARDHRRHQPGGQQLLEAPGRRPSPPRSASATATTRRSAPSRAACHRRSRRSTTTPTLDEAYPFRQGDPGLAGHRRGATADAGLPEPVDRHLPRRLAARRPSTRRRRSRR